MKNGYVVKGFQANGLDLEKINRFTCKELTLDDVYVFKVDLCNNDIDRDFECFSLNALNQLAKQFVGKTGIKNHFASTENQTARIYETSVEKINGRKTATGNDFYVLRAKAYMVRTDDNKNLIKEIEAGIKKEVSVSCSASKNTCSVCSQNKNEKRCQHINGKKYNGKLCYSVLDDITDAYEFSFVAVPAQKEAGVIKSFTQKGENENLNDILKQFDFSAGEVTLSQKDAQEISAYISNMQENANLGAEYKNGLVKQLVSLCSRVVPEMDLKMFEGVANVMTAKELTSFKTAFEKNIASAGKPAPQLAKAKDKEKENYNEFRI